MIPQQPDSCRALVGEYAHRCLPVNADRGGTTATSRAASAPQHQVQATHQLARPAPTGRSWWQPVQHGVHSRGGLAPGPIDLPVTDGAVVAGGQFERPGGVGAVRRETGDVAQFGVAEVDGGCGRGHVAMLSLEVGPIQRTSFPVDDG